MAATASITDISDLTLSIDELPMHLGEELPAAAALVTPDDVLEMHEFLAEFDGNFGRLFAEGAQSSDGVGDRPAKIRARQ